MRRLLTSTFLVLSACTGAQEIATTTAPESTSSSTVALSTSTVPPTTTTTPATTTTTLAPLQSLAYEEVTPLLFPLQVVARPGDSISYVVSKHGLVWAYDGETVLEAPVLDIGQSVKIGPEQGLLSMALHPSNTSLLYVHYSDGNGDHVVSEFTLLSPTEADPASERVLFQVDQPANNHNGGMLQFDPQGVLLLGLGDGGGRGDVYNNGQNPDTLLAGLVAIDVDGGTDPISYAKGLRNPWRFWIDGTLIYVADVGQNAYEEVSVVPLEPGLNYGWPVTEGLHCYRPASGCDPTGHVVPVIEVEHGDADTCSVTGGVVYRGKAIPELVGAYLYSDYCGGWLRSFRYDGGAAVDQTDWTEQVGVPGNVTSLGIDGAGEVYITTTEGLFALVAVR